MKANEHTPGSESSARGKRHTAKPSPTALADGEGRKTTPYRSRDVGHVPTPDPGKFWPFETGQVHVIGTNPLLTFQVDAIHETWIEGTQVLGSHVVRGELHLDLPVVILRNDSGEPLVTLTLRRIAAGSCTSFSLLALLQVTFNPVIPVGRRQ